MNAEAFRQRIVKYQHLADDRRIELLLLCAILDRLDQLHADLILRGQVRFEKASLARGAKRGQSGLRSTR